MNLTHHRPKLVTSLPNGGHVSSVHYTYDYAPEVSNMDPVTLNETCVFYADGTSEVLGTYDDHDRIVRTHS